MVLLPPVEGQAEGCRLAMNVLWLSLGGVLVTCGAVACVIPVLPGPLLSFCGLLCMAATQKSPSLTTFVMFGLITAIATVLDYVVPAIGAKKFKCSKWGTWGCVIGTFVGVFLFPIGLLLGPFVGAFLGELIAGRKAFQAAKGGLGAFLGFLSGVVIKLTACIAMIVCYIHCL